MVVKSNWRCFVQWPVLRGTTLDESEPVDVVTAAGLVNLNINRATN